MPLIPLLGALSWRLRSRRGARLHAFAQAELATRLDLQAAANQCPDPERAARYLRHALDEARHAEAFHSAARTRGFDRPLQADSDQLFRTLGETAFLAFVHRGESRGRRQFEAWSTQLPDDPELAGLLSTIAGDEVHHERYSRALLVDRVGEGPARQALRRAGIWELGRLWLRTGRGLADTLWWLGYALSLPLLWPLALWARRVRPRTAGWVIPE